MVTALLLSAAVAFAFAGTVRRHNRRQVADCACCAVEADARADSYTPARVPAPDTAAVHPPAAEVPPPLYTPPPVHHGADIRWVSTYVSHNEFRHKIINHSPYSMGFGCFYLDYFDGTAWHELPASVLRVGCAMVAGAFTLVYVRAFTAETLARVFTPPPDADPAYRHYFRLRKPLMLNAHPPTPCAAGAFFRDPIHNETVRSYRYTITFNFSWSEEEGFTIDAPLWTMPWFLFPHVPTVPLTYYPALAQVEWELTALGGGYVHSRLVNNSNYPIKINDPLVEFSSGVDWRVAPYYHDTWLHLFFNFLVVLAPQEYHEQTLFIGDITLPHFTYLRLRRGVVHYQGQAVWPQGFDPLCAQVTHNLVQYVQVIEGFLTPIEKAPPARHVSELVAFSTRGALPAAGDGWRGPLRRVNIGGISYWALGMEEGAYIEPFGGYWGFLYPDGTWAVPPTIPFDWVGFHPCPGGTLMIEQDRRLGFIILE